MHESFSCSIPSSTHCIFSPFDFRHPGVISTFIITDEVDHFWSMYIDILDSFFLKLLAQEAFYPSFILGYVFLIEFLEFCVHFHYSNMWSYMLQIHICFRVDKMTLTANKY